MTRMAKKPIKWKPVSPFAIVNGILMFFVCLACLLPFWIILTSSLSTNSLLQKNGVSVFFQGFTFEGYRFLFSMSDLFLHSLGVSLAVSFASALLSVLVCTAAAYVLSKKYLPGRKFLNVFFMVTMFFSGGTIPTYLIIRGIGIYDTIWALILPGAVSTYSILIMRNFFYGLPKLTVV